jgi:phosphoenolpyruvate-protein kinase (PTS system EI component)
MSLGTNDLTQYSVAVDPELDWHMSLAEFGPGAVRLI